MRIEKDQFRTLLALAALTLLFVLGLWLPYRMRMAKLQERMEAAQRQFTSDQQLTRNLVALADDVLELKQILSGAQKYVPEQGELADLLKQISADLDESVSRSPDGRVFDQEIHTGSIAHYSNYSVIPMSLRFKGEYAVVDGFLRRIEAMNRLVRIDRLDMQFKPAERGTNDKRNGSLDVSIDLSAFFSPAAAALGTGSDNAKPDTK